MKKAIRASKEVVALFFKYPVVRSAAGMSYYLTLTIFPFIICVSMILGTLDIQDTAAFALMEGVIPDAAFTTLSDYLSYLSSSGSDLLFIIGLTAMLTSSSAAFRSFTGITGEIQGKMRFSGIMGWIISFLFSILLLVAIYGSALIVLSGQWLMHFLDTHFHIGGATAIWTWIRFVLLFLLLFAVIYSMYLISAPKQTTKMSRFPGALAASIILVATSMLFSRLITASIRYEVLYGSLASFIMLMVWLYICAVILIMGNVLNISVSNIKGEKETDQLLEPFDAGESA